eukprot:SAG31_NODE_2052_length_6556_cov_2.005111_1_plen_1569_part_00
MARIRIMFRARNMILERMHPGPTGVDDARSAEARLTRPPGRRLARPSRGNRRPAQRSAMSTTLVAVSWFQLLRLVTMVWAQDNLGCNDMVVLVAHACCAGPENDGNCDGPVPEHCTTDCGVIFSEYWGQCSLDVPPERRADMSEFMAKCMDAELDSAAKDGSCFTAEDGDACYGAISWAMSTGIHSHPEWYPDLTPSSSFAEFQCSLARNPDAVDCERPPCGIQCENITPAPPPAPSGQSSPSSMPPAPPPPTDRTAFYCSEGAEYVPPPKTCGQKTPWGKTPPTDEERTQAAIASFDPEVRSLLASLTLEQKVGQMVQLNIDEVLSSDWRSDPAHPRVDPEKVRRYARAPYFVGSYLNSPFSGASQLPGANGDPNTYSAMSAEGFRELVNTIQDITMQEGGGIPMLYGLDSVHGANYVREATLFPQQINQAATFDRQAVQQAAHISAKDTKAAGIPWLFAPILGVATKPGWSRVYETFGEDPMVAAELGVAVVRGMQGGADGMGALSDPTSAAACLKHFIGYPNQEISHDRTPNTIPERQLLEYFVPPFKAAIAAGAATMMAAYGSINGVPVTGSRAIMTELLRDELGFTGMIVTDWGEINNLAGYHRVAEDHHDAARVAMQETTLDMSMVPDSIDFGDNVRQLVAAGELPESRVDVAAGRVLQAKKDLGLLDDPFLEDSASNPIGTAADRAVSREVAKDSIVLLKNNEPEHADGGWAFVNEAANWAADYWTTTEMSGPSAIHWTVNQARHEPPLSVEYGNGGPATGNPSNQVDNFAIRFTAEVEFFESGFWKFTEQSDDIGYLTIDGHNVIEPYEGDGGASLGEHFGVMELDPGVHELVYTFVELGGDAYAQLSWTIQPTGSEGWHFASDTKWDVVYTHHRGGTAEFTYNDGRCVATGHNPAPDCESMCSQKRYGTEAGYLPLDCDFQDAGPYGELTRADPNDANPYTATAGTQTFSVDFTTTIVTDETMTWEFLASASDDEITLTVDGEVVYTATPKAPSNCVDIYQQPESDDCNLGVTDAIGHLMAEHPEWYVVNGVMLTPEMGRETTHAHLHYRNILQLDGGQACPLPPCAQDSTCAWDLDYHPSWDPALEGGCAPASVKLELEAGRHTIAYHFADAGERAHLALAWRPYVEHTKVLPILPGERVLVTGPSADSLARLVGGWSIHWQGATADSEFPPEWNSKTVLGAFEELYSTLDAAGSVTHIPGVDINGADVAGANGVSAALSAAAANDVVIVVFGEPVYTEKPGDIDDLALPRDLTNFVADLVAVGTPVVGVLVEGRPRLLNGCLDRASAVVWAGLPGPEGGSAVAEVLLGLHNPSGRLPFTYPRSQLTAPHPYWHYVDSVCSYDGGTGPCREEFAFGTGLQYSEVVYSGLSLAWEGGAEGGNSNEPCAPGTYDCGWTSSWSCPGQPMGTAGEAGDDDSTNYFCCCEQGLWSASPAPPPPAPSGVPGCTPVTVTVTVTNTGELGCKHTVLLFLRDEVRSVTPEEKRLRGFEKVELAAGASEEVTFTITDKEYSFHGIDFSNGPQVEPGRFTVIIGPHSDALTASFTLDRPEAASHSGGGH